jgi:processive 1,2-diacylglycerol beta-glucosyltransferase
MRILLVHPLQRVTEKEWTFGAVEYYRMHKPMVVLNRLYPEFHYATIDSIEPVDDDFLKDFDLIIFCRTIKNPDATKERLDRLGIIFGMDIDDYWHLDPDHILAEHYQKNKIPELICKSLSVSHFVTCTQPILADQIRHLNPNVEVIENGIDTDDPVWKPNKSASNRIRYGFTQGDTHVTDVSLVSRDVQLSLYEGRFYHKCQVVLCGYKGNNTISVGYEKLLTDDLKPLKFHYQYQQDLIMNLPTDGKDKPYRRVWSKDIDVFAGVYDDIDISVAPLKNTMFNNCKSNLKMIEAGFKDCAVIVSEVSPFTPLATSENSFLLSEKTFLGWQRHILQNPEIIKEKKHYLKRDTRKFSLDNLTKKRKDIYEHFVNIPA